MNYFSKLKKSVSHNSRVKLLSISLIISVMAGLVGFGLNSSLAASAVFTVSRVSLDSSNNQADNESDSPSISSDGRYVAFNSSATNLVPGDTNGAVDIFRKDLQTGAILRVSVDSSNTQADNASYDPSISSDGRYVAFNSDASNLVPGDTNGDYDVFRKDLQTGAILRVSVDSSNTQANSDSYSSSISQDGRYVAFESYATNLVPGDTNGRGDIFRKDLQTGAILRVSVDSSNTQANFGSYEPSISQDGRYVAFGSNATNLVPGDTNGRGDIFRKDLQTGAILRVSVDSSNTQANNESYNPSISSDGRYVAFFSEATNLVPGDTNGDYDVFRKDLQTGAILRVSVDSSNTQANSDSYSSSISQDGRYVAFGSNATNLVPGDTNGAYDIFRKDLQTGAILRVSVDSSNTQADNRSYDPSISSDGRYVAFNSDASNLVPGDTNGASDIFLAYYNNAPVLSPIGNKTVNEGQALQFSLSATDTDGHFLTYSTANLPQGALFDTLTGAFSWTPNINQAGSYPIHFQTSDGSLTDSEDITLTVKNFDQPKPQQTILSTLLSLKVSPKTITRGKVTTVKGQLKDASGKGVGGKKVALQAKVLKTTKKKVKGKIKLVKKWIWKTIAQLTTNSQGVFAKKLKPKTTTSYRAVFGKDVGYNAANSKTVKVTVKKGVKKKR